MLPEGKEEAQPLLPLTDLRERLREHNAGNQVNKDGRALGKPALALLMAVVAMGASGIFITSLLSQGALQLGNSKHQRIRIHFRQRGASEADAETDRVQEYVSSRMLAAHPEQQAYYDRLDRSERASYLESFQLMRPNVTEYLQGRCASLQQTYLSMIEDTLTPFKGGVMAEELRAMSYGQSAILYIINGTMYLQPQPGKLPDMIVLYAEYIYWLLQEVEFPDVILPLNPNDIPFATKEPWFSFCKQPRQHNDLLLPNTLEDALFPRSAAELRKPRAGKEDWRLPMAVWLGRPMSWHRGKRKAVVEAGRLHPDKVYSGLTEWEALPIPEGMDKDDFFSWYKEPIPVRDWQETFKYVINVEGNCASARLASQLLGDSAVFWVAGEDQEWYYPLLKPYVHYVPVTVAEDGSTDLVQQVDWAEAHPEEVLEIVQASTQFALQHLLPGSGRDCYTVLLLQAFSGLIKGGMQLPPKVYPYKPAEVPFNRVAREIGPDF